MPSMNDDVPARDAEGRTSFYAEKTAQSLYAQLGLRQVMSLDMAKRWFAEIADVRIHYPLIMVVRDNSSETRRKN